MSLPKYAFEISGWEILCKVKAIISKVCLPNGRLGPFWETQGHTFARLCLQGAGSETSGKFMAMKLRLLCQSMHLRCQVGHLWETRSHSIARVCLRGARFGNIWEGQSLNIARVCLQDVRLGSFLETQARSIPERVSEMPG